MPLLKVENLSKTFDGPAKLFGSEQFYAVKDVSFSLSRKETLAIIGKMAQEIDLSENDRRDYAPDFGENLI